MELDNAFKSLDALRYGDDIEASDELLIEVMANGTLNNLKNLCYLLDNDVKEPYQDEAIMQVIFYFIDKNGIYEGLYELIKNYKIINLRGDFWLYKINLECIQNSTYKECYLDIINKVNDDIKQLIVLNTKKILEYNPEYADEVGEVLHSINFNKSISKKDKSGFKVGMKDVFSSQDESFFEAFLKDLDFRECKVKIKARD